MQPKPALNAVVVWDVVILVVAVDVSVVDVSVVVALDVRVVDVSVVVAEDVTVVVIVVVADEVNEEVTLDVTVVVGVVSLQSNIDWSANASRAVCSVSAADLQPWLL